MNETAFILPVKALVKEVGRMAVFVSRRYKRKIVQVDLGVLKPGDVKKLNRQFLKKNKTTDILTFISETKKGLSAELALNLAQVLKDAKSDTRDAREYFAEVILHGLLHTAGVDHDYTTASLRKVHLLQQKILGEFKPHLPAFAAKKGAAKVHSH